MMKLGALWRKEEYRWSYMSDDELLQRLRKIRNEEKAQNFIEMARRKGRGRLEEAGVAHLVWLRKAPEDDPGEPPAFPSASVSSSSQSSSMKLKSKTKTVKKDWRSSETQSSRYSAVSSYSADSDSYAPPVSRPSKPKEEKKEEEKKVKVPNGTAVLNDRDIMF